MNILVVDDIAMNRKLLCAILDAEGHHIIEAVDGIDGMEVLQREAVDAVISDILMPRMDGYRFCYEVRASERFRNLPFIFHTSSYTSKADEKLAMDMGADKFLTKPAPAAQIIQALQEAASAHRRETGPADPDRELKLMKEYNQQLVAKLEKKNAELSLRNDELSAMHAQLQHLLDYSPAVVYHLRVTGDKATPVVVSENIVHQLGVAMEDALKYGWWLESVHPDDLDRVLEEFRLGIDAGSISVEYRIRHKDGSYRWVADRNRVIKGGSGGTTEVFGVWTDITERKAAEEKIASQLHELQRWREATLNREDRVQALKQEVNELLKKADKPPRYATPGA